MKKDGSDPVLLLCDDKNVDKLTLCRIKLCNYFNIKLHFFKRKRLTKLKIKEKCRIEDLKMKFA